MQFRLVYICDQKRVFFFGFGFFLGWLPIYWADRNLPICVICVVWGFPKVVRKFVVNIFVGEPFSYVCEYSGFYFLSTHLPCIWIGINKVELFSRTSEASGISNGIAMGVHTKVTCSESQFFG